MESYKKARRVTCQENEDAVYFPSGKKKSFQLRKKNE
jgi:hypothetical protein